MKSDPDKTSDTARTGSDADKNRDRLVKEAENAIGQSRRESAKDQRKAQDEPSI
jgi:hypothetical protein